MWQDIESVLLGHDQYDDSHSKKAPSLIPKANQSPRQQPDGTHTNLAKHRDDSSKSLATIAKKSSTAISFSSGEYLFAQPNQVFHSPSSSDRVNNAGSWNCDVFHAHKTPSTNHVTHFDTCHVGATLSNGVSETIAGLGSSITLSPNSIVSSCSSSSSPPVPSSSGTHAHLPSLTPHQFATAGLLQTSPGASSSSLPSSNENCPSNSLASQAPSQHLKEQMPILHQQLLHQQQQQQPQHNLVDSKSYHHPQWFGVTPQQQPSPLPPSRDCNFASSSSYPAYQHQEASYSQPPPPPPHYALYSNGNTMTGVVSNTVQMSPPASPRESLDKIETIHSKPSSLLHLLRQPLNDGEHRNSKRNAHPSSEHLFFANSNGSVKGLFITERLATSLDLIQFDSSRETSTQRNDQE